MRKDIDIKEVTFGVTSAREIQPFITEKGAIKFSMSLKRNNVDSERMLTEITALSDLLSANSNIVSLSLYIENITPELVRILANGLAHNTKLEVLDLRGNDINYQGAKYLNEALKTNTGLRELDLTENSICGHIDTCLEVNRTLKVLSLLDCGIGNRQAAKIFKALENNHALLELNLSKNMIKTGILSQSFGPYHEWEEDKLVTYPKGSVDIMPVIFSFLKNNRRLQTLKMYSNEIEEKDAAKIAAAIEHHFSLSRLDLNSYLHIQHIALPFLKRNMRITEIKQAYVLGAMIGFFEKFSLPPEVIIIIAQFAMNKINECIGITLVNKNALTSAKNNVTFIREKILTDLITKDSDVIFAKNSLIKIYESKVPFWISWNNNNNNNNNSMNATESQQINTPWFHR